MSSDTKEEISFEGWARQVDDEFKRREPLLYDQVLDAAQEDDIDTSEPWPQVRIRGDEPEDSYDDGETVTDYVDFLINEYKVFGPHGE